MSRSPSSSPLRSLATDLSLTHMTDDSSSSAWSGVAPASRSAAASPRQRHAQTDEFEESRFDHLTHLSADHSYQSRGAHPTSHTLLQLSDDFTRMTHFDDDPSVHGDASPAGLSPYSAAAARSTFADETADASTFGDPSYNSHSSYQSTSSDSFLTPSRPHSHYQPQQRPRAMPSAADAASARRTAFFEKDLDTIKAAARVKDLERKRVPLSPVEIDAKRIRIRQIEKRIERLRESHALKKARVAESVQLVKANYDRFKEQNADIATKGRAVIQVMEEVQHRMQAEDLEEAEKELNSAMTQHEQCMATSLQSLPPAVLGPNPQTTIRSMYTSDLPVALLAKQREGGSNAGAVMHTVSAPKEALINVDGHWLRTAPAPSAINEALSESPLPPQPALVERMALSAASAMNAGDKIDRKEYELLTSASEYEKRHRTKRAHADAQARGELGVPEDATSAQHKQWVDTHVLGASDIKTVHGHSFPAPAVPGMVASSPDGQAKRTAFQTLQLEKKKYASYVKVVQDAWTNEREQQRIATITRVNETIVRTNETRSRARIKFEREKVVAMELLNKQRDLLALRDVEAREAAFRQAYRHRAERLAGLLETDGVWRSDQGAHAMKMLQKMAHAQTENTYWNGLPSAAGHRSPSHIEEVSEPVRWRDDLWEHKEWSHHDDSSIDGAAATPTARYHMPHGDSSRSAAAPLQPDDLDRTAPSSPLRSAHHLDQETNSPPSPEMLRRARRRIQAAERDAKAVIAIKNEQALMLQRRRQREEEEAQQDRDDREWLQARQRRLDQEAAAADDDVSDEDTDMQHQAQVNLSLNKSVSFDDMRSPMQQQQPQQQHRQSSDSRHDEKPLITISSPSSRRRPDDAGTVGAGASARTSAHSSGASTPLFTASSNRAAIANRVTATHDLGGDPDAQYDPESDHKHLDPQSRSRHSREVSSRRGSDSINAAHQRFELPEHEYEQAARHNASNTPSSATAHIISPISRAGPSVPPIPTGGLPHLSNEPNFTPSSHVSSTARPSNSYRGDAGGTSSADASAPSTHRSEDDRIFSPISRAGPSVPSMPPGGLPQLGAYDPYSPSSLSAGTPMSQLQPHSARPSTARTNRESLDDLSYIQEHTEHDISGVRSPGAPAGVEDEMLLQQSRHMPSYSGREVAASSSSSMHTAPLQPPMHSDSPRSLPRATLTRKGASPNAPHRRVAAPLSSAAAEHILAADHAIAADRVSPPAPGASDSIHEDLSNEEAAELFGHVDDDIDETPRGQPAQVFASPEPGYDGGAIETLSSSNASLTGSAIIGSGHGAPGVTASGAGLMSMRSSMTDDWDASNEAGDLDAFHVVDPENGFYDHRERTIK